MLSCLDCTKIKSVITVAQKHFWDNYHSFVTVTMIPIPQIGEALSRGRYDVVRTSLEAQLRAITLSLSRLHKDDDVIWSRRVEEASQRLADLLKTVQQHASRASLHNNERLIQLITGQTDGFVRFLQGLDGNPTLLKHKTDLEGMVTSYVSQLQSILSSSPSSATNSSRSLVTKSAPSSMPQSILTSPADPSLSSSLSVQKQSVPSPLSQIYRVHWDRWSSLEDEKVIVESALDGTVLSMAQDFLVSNRSWSRDELEKQIRVWLLPVVESYVSSKNMNGAMDILQNMGCDIWEEIKNICVKTTDSNVRNFLICELNDMQMLSPEEKNASRFLVLVQGAAKNEEIQPVKESVNPDEFVPPESLSISYVLQQSASEHWKNNYITHAYFYSGDGTLEPMLDQDTCWRYMISHNQVDLLKSWIEVTFNTDCPQWFGPGGPQFVKRVSRLLQNWPITQDMIDEVAVTAPTDTKDAVLDALCRYGKVATSERTNIQMILRRLSRSRRLTGFGPKLQLDVTWPNLQKLLFDFCVVQNLPAVAAIWRLNPQPEYSEGWPALYNLHCRLAESPDNLSLTAECVMRCVEYLDSFEESDHSSKTSLLLVANLILTSQDLNCLFNGEPPDTSTFSNSQFQQAAADFPLLGCAVKQTIWPVSPDVDLYNLLQDCTTCDINKVFKWRFSHRKKIVEGESSWCEYPHFSSERLISKYGYNDTLSLSYYLREGRPSFAACTLWVEEALSSGRVSNKTLKDVCQLAHGLALQNFSNKRITASCAAFIEILGRSSATLRTQIAVASLIYAHETARTGDPEQSCSRVSMLLKDLSLGHQERPGREMLSIMDRILEQKLYAVENDFDLLIRNKVSLLFEQGLEAKFAAVHHLPYPERFIRKCAQTGHWIVALLFCQIHGYPQSSVFKMLEEIPDQKIRQHLRCVFAHRATRLDPLRLKSSSSRANFDSRAGNREELPMTASVLSKISRESTDSEMSQSEGASLRTFPDQIDLVEILVRCHSDSHPAAILLYNALSLPNPTLALIAVCYERDWELRGFCVWLASWLRKSLRTSFLQCVGSQIYWTADSTEQVLIAALKEGLVVTIQRGFTIFLPDNPLKILFDVLVDCIESRLFEGATGNLKHFFEASHDYKVFIFLTCIDEKKCPVVNLCSTPLSVLKNRCWAQPCTASVPVWKMFAFEDPEVAKPGNNALLRQLKIRGSEHFIYEHSWLALTAIKLCTVALLHCFTSSRHQYLFLKALSDAEITSQLTDCYDSGCNVAQFAQLARILECVMPAGIYLNIERWLHNSQEENKRCVDLLVQCERYDAATELTKIANLPVDTALTTQLAARLKQCLSETPSDFKPFWKDCEAKLTNAGISSETASKFYRECALRLSSSLDRFTALRLALKWLRWKTTESEVQRTEWQLHLISAAEVENIEKEMWMNCIQAGEEAVKELKEVTSPTPLIDLNSTTLNSRRATLWKTDQEGPSSLRGQTEDKVDELIGNLLDMGDIAAACRVETLFGVHNKDLTILLACLAIAEEKLRISECISNVLPDILSSSPSSPGLKYSRQGSMFSKDFSEDDIDVSQAVHSEYVEIPSREKQEALAAIQGLCERLNHGRRIGAQFAACYRLAMNLDLKFQDVLRVGEPLKLLRTALTEACWDQIVVAADLLETFQLAPNQVAEFLAREIVSAIGKGAAEGRSRNCLLWGREMEKIFHRVLNLAPDTGLLAKELLNIARRQNVSSPDAPHDVLDTVTELLIRAHYCYTSACNMEGIASVLSDARLLTTELAKRQEWRMMVRLLTGIQRFTEMSYVFRILKDNKQFEFLLRRDIDKINKGKAQKKFQEYPDDELEYLLRKDTDKPVGLKVALLGWLRRECPEETSLHKMTALHFGMYRELAGLWKGEAESRCRFAVSGKMLNNQATLNLLTTVMQDYSHGAEYYLQANMLTHAVHCAHQAELAALQHHLVASASPDQPGRQVLLLDSKTVSQLVTNTLSFPQAKILIRAYNHNTDWGSALFQHCVVTSSEAEVYLAAWTGSYELTPSLLQDIALRFQRSRVITRDMARNMRRVLNCMQDVEVRYRIASQLGFKDFVEGMLGGVEAAYLKDTVWQSGFRN